VPFNAIEEAKFINAFNEDEWAKSDPLRKKIMDEMIALIKEYFNGASLDLDERLKPIITRGEIEEEIESLEGRLFYAKWKLMSLR